MMEYSTFYKNTASWKRPYHLGRAKLAKFWASLFSKVDIIGITGSVGKTTTKEAIIKVLDEKFQVIGTKGNLDPVFNIPMTLLKIRPATQKVVLEMGIEYPNEMGFYLDLAKPKIGVITRVYWTHTEFLQDLDGVIAEKGKLLEAIPADGVAVLNFDDESVREKMAPKTSASIFWYGSYPDVDLQISDFLHQGEDGSRFKLRYISRSPSRQDGNGAPLIFSRKLANKNDEIEINWKLIGEHQTTAAAAAASVGILSGLNLPEIKKGLEKLEPQPHRMNLIKGPKQSLILDDSYNSSPIAVVMALETLRSLAHKGRAIAVLGDMLELGKYGEQGHKEVGQKVAEENIDYLITLGEKAKIISDEARKRRVKNILEGKNITQIISEIKKNVSKDDIILVKASRHAHFERIMAGLTGQPTQISCPVCGMLD